MTGFGPRRGSEADRESAAETVDRDAAAAMAYQFYVDGQKSVTHGGYQAGHDLAFDVGYGARNDHVRSFVTGILEGHAAGLEARRELIEAVKAGWEPGGNQHFADLRAGGLPGRGAQPQPEQEAEAG